MLTRDGSFPLPRVKNRKQSTKHRQQPPIIPPKQTRKLLSRPAGLGISVTTFVSVCFCIFRCLSLYLLLNLSLSLRLFLSQRIFSTGTYHLAVLRGNPLHRCYLSQIRFMLDSAPLKVSVFTTVVRLGTVCLYFGECPFGRFSFSLSMYPGPS